MLSNLTNLRLSYNSFIGSVPEDLGNLTQLTLFHLHSNRISGAVPHLNVDESIWNDSSVIADCGVPSAFDDPLECDNCTMCCKFYCFLY